MIVGSRHLRKLDQLIVIVKHVELVLGQGLCRLPAQLRAKLLIFAFLVPTMGKVGREYDLVAFTRCDSSKYKLLPKFAHAWITLVQEFTNLVHFLYFGAVLQFMITNLHKLHFMIKFV